VFIIGEESAYYLHSNIRLNKIGAQPLKTLMWLFFCTSFLSSPFAKTKNKYCKEQDPSNSTQADDNSFLQRSSLKGKESYAKDN